MGKASKWVQAVTPAWIFFLPIPSSPFFVLLPSVQHSTVQVQQYYTWLIPNLAGWEIGCCFHLSCQMNKLDNILDRLSVFLAKLPYNCPCAPECSVCCSTQSSGKSSEDLWKIWSPTRQCVSVLCSAGRVLVVGWVSSVPSKAWTLLLCSNCTQTLPSELVVREFFFSFVVILLK